jgi:hypothetical protein
MKKIVWLALFFINYSHASNPDYLFCKSQLKNTTPCEIIIGKKNSKSIRSWIKNLKKVELKTIQESEDLKKEITSNGTLLAESKKELDVVKAQIIYRMEEFKGLKVKFDTISGQLTHQLDENTRIKKNYDNIVKKYRKFTNEYNIQNRIIIVLGILFVLALFLLIKKAKETYESKKEIAVLRTKMKEFLINPDEHEEFPVTPIQQPKESHLSTQQ